MPKAISRIFENIKKNYRETTIDFILLRNHQKGCIALFDFWTEDIIWIEKVIRKKERKKKTFPISLVTFLSLPPLFNLCSSCVSLCCTRRRNLSLVHVKSPLQTTITTQLLHSYHHSSLPCPLQHSTLVIPHKALHTSTETTH